MTMAKEKEKTGRMDVFVRVIMDGAAIHVKQWLVQELIVVVMGQQRMKFLPMDVTATVMKDGMGKFVIYRVNLYLKFFNKICTFIASIIELMVLKISMISFEGLQHDRDPKTN